MPRPMMIDQNLNPRSYFCPSTVLGLLRSVKFEPTVSVGFSVTFSTLSALWEPMMVVIIAAMDDRGKLLLRFKSFLHCISFYISYGIDYINPFPPR